MSRTPAPTFDQWVKQDFPKVRAAYVKKQGHQPDAEWVAFQSWRYAAYWLGLGEYWPIERMLAEEANPGSTKQEDYPQP